MIRIAKRFTFDSGHHLTGLPDGHKCMRPHGHTYAIEVVLAAHELGPEGWVMDYGDLSALVKTELADGHWDHYDLNDRMEQPTAERIAIELHEMFTRRLTPGRISVASVKVWEGAGDSWAEYAP